LVEFASSCTMVPEVNMPVREEAFPFAAPPAVAAVALAVLGFYAAGLVLGLAALAVCAFFRDPDRHPGSDPEVLVSPADGRILQASAADGVLKISVFMSVFNVHVNRCPWSGTVESVTYHPGRFLAAWDDKASLDNEQVRIRYRTGRGWVEMVMIAGLVARRIVYWARPGAPFGTGERVGLIRFGSRVDLFLPEASARALVVPGDRVKAGATPVARWVAAP
jgi:phosphatidylserine decarboxylase